MPLVMLPGMVSINNPDDNEQGAGIYAIPCLSHMGSIAGFSPNTLIRLKYNIPSRQSYGGAGNEHDQEVRQQPGPERQVVVRRFHLAFQLDLGLIIKLVAMVFFLSQDASAQKLILLIIFASLIYLYQTRSFAPLLRRVLGRQGDPQMHVPLRLQNDPRDRHDGKMNCQLGENNDVGNMNQNQPANNHEQPNANENHQEPVQHEHIFWQVFKEIRMFVFGFLTSLLPGLHDHD
ncbi:hypothetical protein Cni_G22295 [Canna indica]|uniref:Uncharacterized protein n=1 Tax=Canna indica TaxID=4628 RepID=A0AAQ3KRN0_9LILI|nr:hypothetical protein Cni_G22295 [Canna indica]